MRNNKPLAAAAERNKGKPGRPRSVRPEAMLEHPLPPRLLDLEGSATYLSVSPWTVRDLEAAGVLSRVRIPLPNGGQLRKLLFDREDLDRLVAEWKEPS